MRRFSAAIRARSYDEGVGAQCGDVKCLLSRIGQCNCTVVVDDNVRRHATIMSLLVCAHHDDVVGESSLRARHAATYVRIIASRISALVRRNLEFLGRVISARVVGFAG